MAWGGGVRDPFAPNIVSVGRRQVCQCIDELLLLASSGPSKALEGRFVHKCEDTLAAACISPASAHFQLDGLYHAFESATPTGALPAIEIMTPHNMWPQSLDCLFARTLREEPYP